MNRKIRIVTTRWREWLAAASVAYPASGIRLGIGQDITARITERADKSFSTYVYYSMDIGATRLEEVKVVEILCDEDL